MLKFSRTFSNIHVYPLPLSRNFGLDNLLIVASVVQKKIRREVWSISPTMQPRRKLVGNSSMCSNLIGYVWTASLLLGQVQKHMHTHRCHSNEKWQVFVHECLPLQALICAVVENLYRPKFSMCSGIMMRCILHWNKWVTINSIMICLDDKPWQPKCKT